MTSIRITECALLIVATASAIAADAPMRPNAAKGPGATTLLIYAEQRSSYSLADSLALLKMQLQRVATRLETIPLGQVTSSKLSEADYVVVFCPQSAPALTSNLFYSVTNATQPLLWIGFGADQLEGLEPFSGQFEVSAFAAPRV